MNLMVAGAIALMFTASYAAADPINLALAVNGGVASESSNYHGLYPAGNVIDGDYGSHNHTDAESQAWVEVAFNQTYFISDVTVYNRYQCCQERINPFSVFLYDSGNNVVWSETNQTIAVDQITWFGAPNAFGDRLRLQLDGGNYLHIAELEAYEGTPPVSSVPEPASLLLLATGIAGYALRRCPSISVGRATRRRVASAVDDSPTRSGAPFAGDPRGRRG